MGATRGAPPSRFVEHNGRKGEGLMKATTSKDSILARLRRVGHNGNS